MPVTIPKLVNSLCYDFDAWVVGSAADSTITEYPRDWDVIVPWYTWEQAKHLIPYGTPSNSFGGFKVNINNVEIDIWPGDLGKLFINERAKFAWQPRYGIYLRKETRG